MTRPRLAGLTLALGVVLGSMAVPAFAAGTDVQQTWHAEQAHVQNARDAGRNGGGVIVAVLDSWVDRAHPDFEGRVLPGADCLGGRCTDGPASSDECDHGTHVSGTIAASSFGVAPGAQVLPVRVLAFDPESGECVGRPADVAAGIEWAVAQGARVINLSLGPDVPGLSASTSIPAAVDDAARAGALVVFSAGNASLPMADAYGGSALIVAATGPSGRLASYSQRGVGVTLAAPGGDPETKGVCRQEDCVTSLFPGARYSVAAGTSMAAPHVSGIAALLIAQDPSRTREQVRDRLLDTATPLANAGRGLVDAGAALGVDRSVGPQGTPTSPTSPTSPTAASSPVPTVPDTASPPEDASSVPAAPSVQPTPVPSPAPATDPPVSPVPKAVPPGGSPGTALPGRSTGLPDIDPQSRPLPPTLVAAAALLLLLTGAGSVLGLRRR